MSKKRGLGKGLQALLPVSKDENKADSGLKEILVASVRPNPRQPRQVLDQDKLNELVESIREHGVVQPIVVRPLGDEKYELIAGERRWRACVVLELETVPAVIKDYADLEASAVALIENVQRENLNPLEEANAYRRLMDDFGLTQEEVSRWVGKSRPFVGNMVRLLGLPLEIQDMMNDGLLSMGHTRAILGLKDKNAQLAAAMRIVKKNLNVRQAEDMIRAMAAMEEEIVQEKVKNNYKRLPVQEKYLQAVFGTSVKVKTKSDGGGRIIIDFATQTDLGRIMELFDVIDDKNKAN